MKNFNPVLAILGVLALLFSLIIILFVDVDSFEKVKDLSFVWLGIIGVILAFFGGFFICLIEKTLGIDLNKEILEHEELIKQ